MPGLEFALTAFGLIHLPTLLVCAGFYGAGRYVRPAGLGRFMRASAIFWAVVLFIAATYLVIGPILCDGNFLYGYRNCTAISEEFANFSLVILVFAYVPAMIFGAVLALVAAIVAWRDYCAARAADNVAGP